MRKGLFDFFGRSSDERTSRDLSSRRLGVYHRLLRCEHLEDRRLLSGVTLITHGYWDDTSDWITSMAGAVREYSDSDYSTYTITVEDPGSEFTRDPLQLSLSSLDGTHPLQSESGDLQILLDWSDVRDSPAQQIYIEQRETGEVAEFVVPYLLDNGFIPELAGHSLAEYQFHLVGHSRGASLVCELSRLLGEHGVSVDHVTMLDPNDAWDLKWPGADDPDCQVYSNVSFAEAYYQQSVHGIPWGSPVEGAYNRLLTSTGGISSIVGGYPNDHGDVHLWYHGTIDIDADPIDDGSAVADPSQWYDDVGPRNEVGYHFSRIAGGDRLQDASSGLRWAGAGREPVSITSSGSDVWDNVEISSFLDERTVQKGQYLNVTVRYEDGGSQDAMISVGYDTDTNPYNTPEISYYQVQDTPSDFGALPFSVATTALEAGDTYYVYAKISNGEHTRYYYAPGTVTITSGAGNEDPVLSDGEVTPPAGTDTTYYTYRVHYFDADQDAPVRAEVLIDGIRHTMSLESGNEYDGTYRYRVSGSELGPGTHQYMFIFEDGNGGYDATSSQLGPTVTEAGEAALWFYSAGYGGTPFNDDYEIRYSINGGTKRTIKGSELIVPGVTDVITAPASIQFEAWTLSGNHSFGEWEFRQNGQVIPGGNTTSPIVNVDLTSQDLAILSFWDYTPQPYDVGGIVTVGGSALTGTVVTATGWGGTYTATTEADGSYLFDDLPGGVRYTLEVEHSDYAFAPPSYTIPILTSSASSYDFAGISADNIPPEVTITGIPAAYVDDTTQVTFTWAGSDNSTPTADLEFRYRLVGAANEDWSAWATGDTTSYDLPNGAYRFELKVRDDNHNESRIIQAHDFVVSASPRVSDSQLVDDGIWLGIVEVTAPADATSVSDKVILQSEQFGLGGESFVPVRLYSATTGEALGTVEYAPGEVGLPVVFEDVGQGYSLTLPTALNPGETAEYVVQWGSTVNFGWQPSVSVALANTWSESGVGLGRVLNTHLDSAERVWRLRDEQDWLVHNKAIPVNSSLWLEVIDPATGNLTHRQLEYAPANYYTQTNPNDPSDVRYCGTRRTFNPLTLGFVETDDYTWAFWLVEEVTYRAWDPTINEYRRGFGFQQFDNETLEPIGDPAYSNLTLGACHTGPALAPDGSIWILREIDDTTLGYSKVDSSGTLVTQDVPFATHPGDLLDPLWGSVDLVLADDGKVWCFYEREWTASATNSSDRSQLYVKILNPDGSVFLDETAFSPPPVDPTIPQSDGRYFGSAPVVDHEGKVWVTFGTNGASGTHYLYSIFNADGTLFKDQIETTVENHNFRFVDSDGYVWATESGALHILNPDDTQAEPAHVGTAITPTQQFGRRAARVSADSYRLFDRWSDQSLVVSLSSETYFGSMEIWNVDKFGQDAYVHDLDIAELQPSHPTIPGRVPNVSTLDATSVLGVGNNALTLTQSALLGGEIIVSFEPGLTLGRIAGAVWDDTDGDGVWDQPEESVGADWKVYLDDNGNGSWDDGELFQLTDQNGGYEFAHLAPGAYTVMQATRSGWEQTEPAAGGHQVNVAAGGLVSGVQFGVRQLASIEGRKWHDYDSDGIWDGGEPPLADWKIYLDQNSNDQWDADEPFRLTDTNGEYFFLDLSPGTYVVAEVQEPDWEQTYPDESLGGQRTHVLTLGSAEDATGIDFGNRDTNYTHLVDLLECISTRRSRLRLEMRSTQRGRFVMWGPPTAARSTWNGISRRMV